MPLINQKSTKDTSTQYVPPPNAYQKPAVRSVPINPTTPTEQATKIARNAIGSFRERAERRAQERAERIERRTQEQIERAIPQRQRQTSQPPRATVARPQPTTIYTSGVSWQKQMYVFTILLLIGYGIWLLDGAFTVIGAITTILPATLIGVGIAVVGHFFVSWGQHSLIFHPRLIIKIFGLLLVILNAASNVYGVIGAAKVLRPALLGTLPNDPVVWLGDLARWIGGLIYRTISQSAPEVQTPAWGYTALIVLVLAIVLAWYAEKIRDYFHHEWKMLWAQRPN